MKSYAVLALLVSCVCAAPTTSVNGSLNAAGANGKIEVAAKGFKAALYLFAPDSWITSWNAVPEEGQNCFLKAASDPANAAIYNSDDSDAIKADLKTRCPTGATELSAFSDVVAQTIKSLPTTFLEDAKAWGVELQALGEKFKSTAQTGAQNVQGAVATGAQAAQTGAQNAQTQAQAMAQAFKQDPSSAKEYIAQFANSTAAFTDKLAKLSQEDRQQISTVFPKLTPFISGDHAVEFLNEVTDLYELLGNGLFNKSALQTEGLELKAVLKQVWDEYKTQNAEGLTQAGLLLGKDLTKAGDAMEAQNGAQANGFKAKFAAAHPEVVNALKEGQDKLSENKAKFQAWASNVKEAGSENLDQLKQQGQQAWSQLKQTGQERLNEIKDKTQQLKDKLSQQNSVNGQASVGSDNAAASLNFN